MLLRAWILKFWVGGVVSIVSRDLKEKVRKIVQQRNLCSYMNATKWKELRNAMMDEMPFPPPFIIKYLDTECIEEADFQNDVWHWGDWYYAWSACG